MSKLSPHNLSNENFPRHIQEEWVLDIKDQCTNANVAFYFKQWGGTNKKKAGKALAGKVYNEMPNIV